MRPQLYYYGKIPNSIDTQEACVYTINKVTGNLSSSIGVTVEHILRDYAIDLKKLFLSSHGLMFRDADTYLMTDHAASPPHNLFNFCGLRFCKGYMNRGILFILSHEFYTPIEIYNSLWLYQDCCNTINALLLNKIIFHDSESLSFKEDADTTTSC